MQRFRLYLKISGGIIVGLVFLTYIYFQTQNLLAGAKLTIETPPRNGLTFTDTLITISGTAKNIAFISLNDRQIFVDETGRFEELSLLATGYNIITIAAKDRFGRVTKKTLEMVYRPK
jgi:hypothetical protein